MSRPEGVWLRGELRWASLPRKKRGQHPGGMWRSHSASTGFDVIPAALFRHTMLRLIHSDNLECKELTKAV
jgi:hypothetical protein